LVLQLLLSWYFSTIGKASFDGGPAVIFLFLFTAIACSFAAFAYAEFASMVPVSGSAYTYSYVAFRELIAWFIGLIMGHWEYYSRHILERLFYEFNGEYH
jgi:amino acid transporter